MSTLKGNRIRWIKEGRRWRREVSCPQCGRIMTAKGGNKRYACENKSCAVIEVRFSKSGAAEVLVDAVKHRNWKHKKLGGRAPRSLSLPISKPSQHIREGDQAP